MAELKTKPIKKDVNQYIQSVENAQVRQDCETLRELMGKITNSNGVMWGESIIGFGKYHYKYESGREGDWFLTGFSPRKQNLTLYIMSGFSKFNDLMAGLGKYKTGKACLYVKSLDDIDIKVLESLLRGSLNHLKKRSAAD